MVPILTASDVDVVIVGSGPGGSTVARQLAQAGKKVLVLERGLDYRRKLYYGTYLGALRYTDRASFLFTREGLNIIRPLMVGGATSMYCGSAARPPAWLRERYGLDLERHVDETIEELKIAPLPPELRGAASGRIAEAAASLGMDWQPLPKFMDPARARRFDCGAKCMLGCRCGAKWNAAEYLDEAVAAGCELITSARANRVLIEDGQAIGVEGVQRGRPFQVRARVVVLAAGGIGTPRILQASGLTDAGRGLAMDTTLMVYGTSRYKGIGDEPPMTYAWADDEHGYMLSTLIDPWLLYPLIMALKGLRYSLTWPRYGRTLGVMVKIKDHVSGEIGPGGSISKPLTEPDQARLDHAIAVCRRILLKVGCEPDSIFPTPPRGTHPSATVRLGEMLTSDLETAIHNLYVCDASIFPEALDRPTVLTIIGLAKRLSDHLLAHVVT